MRDTEDRLSDKILKMFTEYLLYAKYCAFKCLLSFNFLNNPETLVLL